MADDRYRDNWTGGGRGRSNSIFPDDGEGSRGSRDGGGDWGRSSAGDGPGGDGRGLFERARDGVSSWLGGEGEGSGGRASPERSRYGQGQSGFGGEHYRSNSAGSGREQSGGSEGRSGSGGSYPRRDQSGTSHFDENYRRWREQQIARLDEEYEEYCRERQQRFESDFHSWREQRQARGSQSEGGQASAASQPWGNEVENGESRSLGSGGLGTHEAGETTTGGGDASAMRSSTGSSPETDADGQGRN